MCTQLTERWVGPALVSEQSLTDLLGNAESLEHVHGSSYEASVQPVRYFVAAEESACSSSACKSRGLCLPGKAAAT